MVADRLARDAELAHALASLAPAGIRIGHRFITPGDEDALLVTESANFQAAVIKVRRQSGAARIVARQILADIGMPGAALPRSASGAPSWPPGIVGSLAHDGDVAVAAIASTRQFAALGIDVEPAVPLPPEVIAMVTTPGERARYPARVVESRLLFAIKEAAYKALNPTDGVFLEFHDVEVDLDANLCRTRHGRQIAMAFTTTPRTVAVCFL